MRRFIYFVLILVVLACGWFAVGAVFFSRAEEEFVELVTPAKRDLKSVFHASGRVAPSILTQVKSEVSGRVVEVLVAAGDRVKRGDRLLELDQSELESEMRESERMIESARLRAERSRIDQARKKLLHRDHLVSDQEFEQSEIDAALADNEFAVAQARLDTLAQKLAKTTIYAPHDGVILNLVAREGSVITGATSVSEGTPLMEVAVLNSLQVEANVNEVDIAGLEKGMPVQLTFDSLPGIEADGEVSFVSPSAVPDPENKNRHVFPVKIVFQAAQGKIRPGITAKVAIPLEEADNVMALPVPVVFTSKSESFVYVKKADGWEKRTIETGIADGQFVQVLKGLKESDQVARTRPSSMETPPL